MTVTWTQKRERGRKATYQKLSLNESSPRENKFKWKFNKRLWRKKQGGKWDKYKQSERKWLNWKTGKESPMVHIIRIFEEKKS